MKPTTKSCLVSVPVSDPFGSYRRICFLPHSYLRLASQTNSLRYRGLASAL